MPGQERSVFHNRIQSNSAQDRDVWDVLAASDRWRCPWHSDMHSLTHSQHLSQSITACHKLISMHKDTDIYLNATMWTLQLLILLDRCARVKKIYCTDGQSTTIQCWITCQPSLIQTSMYMHFPQPWIQVWMMMHLHWLKIALMLNSWRMVVLLEMTGFPWNFSNAQ